MKSKDTLTISTFNVRGLSKQYKQEQLSRDLKRYKVDVCAMQETKVKYESDTKINGFRLIFLETKNVHYGNGFMISPELFHHVHRYWSVSDRVSVLQIHLNKDENRKSYSIKQNLNQEMKYKFIRKGETYKCIPKIPTVSIKCQNGPDPKSLISIINVYAPTNDIVEKDDKILQNMYEEINNTINILKNKSMIFIAGDLNAKVGKKTSQYINDSCLGNFSRGTRNSTGQQLIDFCIINNLFIANSAFQHKAAHITTWEQNRINPRNPSKRITTYNQIDYIICKANIKHTLINSRSFKGTETSSDHRLVICTLSTNKYKRFKNHNIPSSKKFNIHELSRSKEMQEKYQRNLALKLENTDQNSWENIQSSIIEVATETVGFQVKSKNHRKHNPVVSELSTRQKDLRIQISNTKDVIKINELKTQRNRILHSIEHILNEDKNDELDQIATNIDKNYHNNTKMYQAVKMIYNRKPFEVSTVHDKNGKHVSDPSKIYNIVREHFRKHFTDPNEPPIKPFIGQSRPLHKQITTKEVKETIMKLKNNRAAGYDNIVAELLKFAHPMLYKIIAQILNQIFETHTYVNVGHGILAALQKPGKPKGPTKNLRPVILLTMLRKILSNIVLKRIQPKVEQYLSHSQSAYRAGHSTSDIVWSHRFLAARIQKYEEELYITGIDMSSAFDTIKRTQMLTILESFLERDEVRMIRVLLSNTVLQIKTSGVTSVPFETNIGSPQGDGLSGCLFNIYLEKALQSLRERIINNNYFLNDHTYSLTLRNTLPSELIYADDTDFIHQNSFEKDKLAAVVSSTFNKFNLKINETKTENTILKRDNKANELWRSTKKLGSLLGDAEDITQRKLLSTQSLQKLNNIWIRKNKIRPEIRIKLYKSIVKPVLLYNSQTWGLTKSDEINLNSFHRRQLRIMLHIKYPTIISNKDLYHTTSEIPLSLTILKLRWSLFGHILRLPEETPSRMSMTHYFTSSSKKGFKGRQRVTLPVTISKDLKRAHQNSTLTQDYGVVAFDKTSDLNRLAIIAKDRKLWKNLSKDVFEAAQAEELINLDA